jgi:hypothetical protein
MLFASTCGIDRLIHAEKTRRLGLGDIVQCPQIVWAISVRSDEEIDNFLIMYLTLTLTIFGYVNVVLSLIEPANTRNY